jgi:hypothetical protein
MNATTMNWQGPWNATQKYGVGDVVNYLGGAYIAVQTIPPNNPAPPSAGWETVLAPAMVWQGQWQNEAGYQPNDLVSYLGASYIATQMSQPNSTPPPGTAWWTISSPSITWRGEWSDTVQYQLNDAVSYQNSDYIAVNVPPIGDNPTDTQYWDVMTSNSQLEQQGLDLANIISLSASGLSIVLSSLALIPAFKSMLTDPLSNLQSTLSALQSTVSTVSAAAQTAQNTAQAARNAVSVLQDLAVRQADEIADVSAAAQTAQNTAQAARNAVSDLQNLAVRQADEIADVSAAAQTAQNTAQTARNSISVLQNLALRQGQQLADTDYTNGLYFRALMNNVEQIFDAIGTQ